jgi:sporulation protein YlmC with PRC-barrel domain
MVLLTRLLGQPVHARNGTTVGRLRDLTVRHDREHPLVTRLMVGNRRQPSRKVAWDHVRHVGLDGVRLNDEPVQWSAP